MKKRIICVLLVLACIANLATRRVEAGPTSNNYELKEFGFGSGGTASSSSTNYAMFGTAGETNTGQLSSANYKSNTGLTFTIQANVPPAPTITNPSNYYNKLSITISTGGNASTTEYAIAVSPDAFSSTTQYVQADDTLGNSPVWQKNSVWGAGGFTIIGLASSTTYTAKVAARMGNFTQTGFGPSASAATVGATLSFDLDVSASDTDTDPPYLVQLGTLTPGSVTTASKKIWVDLSTNATSGGTVYVYGANNGLSSTTASTTITSSSTDLTSAAQGYGAQSASTTQSSGGPMEALSPYNGSSDNVGALDSSKRVVFDSSGAPVTSGRVALNLKAKASNTTPAGNDYSDTVTIIAAGTF